MFPDIVRAVAGLAVRTAAQAAAVAVQLGDHLDDVSGAEGSVERVTDLHLSNIVITFPLPTSHLLQTLLQLRGLVLKVGDPVVQP